MTRYSSASALAAGEIRARIEKRRARGESDVDLAQMLDRHPKTIAAKMSGAGTFTLDEFLGAALAVGARPSEVMRAMEDDDPRLVPPEPAR